MDTNTTFPTSSSNINLLWASLFIEELIRNDISDFCIAPGSRSTPLTLAIVNHQQARTHVHFDERGLGFLALGLAQASQKPVVIVTTSGTAVANLYPAVIEARQSGLPLIVISADRPAELLNCGANQAIDQHAIFADYPVFFSQIVQPSTEIKPNYLLTTINHGLHSQKTQPGPIHFNIAFSEPLYPSNTHIDYHVYLTPLKKWSMNHQPFTTYVCSHPGKLAKNAHLNGKKVLFIMGKMFDRQEAVAVTDFCKKHNFVLLADIQSSQSGSGNTLPYYDLLLINSEFKRLLDQAELIVQFGEQLVSKRLSIFMEHFVGEQQLVSTTAKRIDPNHQLDQRFHCDATQWISAQQISHTKNNNQWVEQLTSCHDGIAKKVILPFIKAQPFSELTVINALDTLLKKETLLFIGNSMPIRIADMIMVANQSNVFSNRGASGIDGLLATAIGVAKCSAKKTTLLIGDTSFLYDLNSLALLKQLQTPFNIIVINNDGGGIFNLLPVPEEQKKEFYQLPDGLNFKAICEQFCIDYYNPNQVTDFKDTYNRSLQSKHSLIEITLPNQQSATQLQQLKEQVHYATL